MFCKSVGWVQPLTLSLEPFKALGLQGDYIEIRDEILRVIAKKQCSFARRTNMSFILQKTGKVGE